VCVPDQVAHVVLWVKGRVLVGHHTARSSVDTSTDTEVEQDGCVRSDFQMEEDLGVDKRRDGEDGRKRSEDERDKPKVRQVRSCVDSPHEQ